jgi:hypothetical protein
MVNSLIKFFSYLPLFLKDFFIDNESKKFIKYCHIKWRAIKQKDSEGEILVELYGIDQTVLAFSYLANLLSKKHKAKIICFSISNWHPFLLFIRFRRILHIYKSFHVLSHIQYRDTNIFSEECDFIFKKLKLKIRTKIDILDISIQGHLIGNEIYESFLRENSVATIDINSENFNLFLKKCIMTYLFWKRYFDFKNVKAVILSHGIYRYGIVKVIANNKNIPVYLPTIRSLYCLRTKNEWGLPPYKLFPSFFASLSSKEKLNGILWAKKRLHVRLSGKLSSDMLYATESAYLNSFSATPSLKKSKRLKILIASHCFFDNPNGHGKNLFPDFYEWIRFLGDISEITDYDWYIKTHPDMLPGNEKIINTFLNDYKKITLINPKTSHLQLIKEGINCVLTVYGSIGHEYPLFNKIVVNAGSNNPHSGYKFNIHCETIAKYKKALLGLSKIKLDFDKNQIYEFYYINHKYFGYNKLFLDSFEKFVNSYPVKLRNSSIIYHHFLKKITEKAHNDICEKITKFINSGFYKYFDSKDAESFFEVNYEKK